MKKLLLFLPVLFFLFSCKKTTPPTDSTTASPTNLKLKVHHLWDPSTDFQLNTWLVNPLNGDSLKFGHFQYYLSNVKLQKDNGTWWKMPESYFIVNTIAPEKCLLDLGNVPSGNYTAISYTLGVDSTHNVSGSQTGALDPSNSMFWGWTSGYIMLLSDGASPNIPQGDYFSLHMTGYMKPYSIVDTVAHTFPTALNVSASTLKTVVINCNPAYIWQSGSIANFYSISGAGVTTQHMATNFHSTFNFEGFE